MKNRKKLFVFVAATFLFIFAFSQNPLRIQLAGGSVIPPTADTGSNFSFDVLIFNDDTATYTGHINFAYSIDTTAYQNSNQFSGFEYDTSQSTIQGNDSIVKTLIAHVNNPVFIVGPSVVVIWPIATNGIATDSLTISFVVTTHASGINEADNKRLELLVYGNSLRVIRDAEIQLRHVRIYEVSGKAILDEQYPSDYIHLPEINTGIYFAEVTYNNNQRKIFRFYR